MKEGIAKNLARVTSALFNVLMGEGVVLPVDHVRKVRNTPV
jgi:hypothetical protein